MSHATGIHWRVPATLLIALLVLILRPGSVVGAEQMSFEVKTGEPATLTFWNRPIATFHAEVDDIRPQDRVERATRKIATILESSPGARATAVPGSLANLSGFFIQIDGQQAFALIPQDIDGMSGETLEQAVRQTVTSLQEALDARREQKRLPLLLQGAGLAFVATLALAAMLWGVGWLHRRALERQRLLASVALKVGGLDLHPLLRSVERGAIKLTSLGLVAIAVYVWLTFVLGLFPLTRPWANQLAKFLMELAETLASGALEALPGLFTVLVIFVLTRMVARSIDGFFTTVERGLVRVSWLAPDTARATRRLTAVLIWIFALTVAYPYIPGSESDAFKGISVFVGLMVSLGSAGLINQVMSGLVVAYSRALRAGEYVKVGETEGTVTEVGILSTKVMSPRREAITVPNAVLIGSAITNYSRLADDDGAVASTTVTIGYDTPWRQVHAMLALAAERTPDVRKDPKPFVLQRSLSDFYPEYQLVFNLDHPDQRIRVLSELHANIQDVFNEYGVQIMSPHFELQPAEKVWSPREQWHAAPARPPESEPEMPDPVRSAS